MLKLTVSSLDRWVHFVEPERPEFEITTAQFLAEMRGQVPKTAMMAAGSALHEMLEKAARPGSEWKDAPWNGFNFHFDVESHLELPVVREPEIMEKLFHTPVGPVVLRGRVDGRDRIKRVIDYKLTKKFDAERYGESLQWRSYLVMTGARRFRYIVFQGSLQKKKKDDTLQTVNIYDVHDFDEWAYPGMEQDVHRRVSELADFVSRAMPGELEIDRDVEGFDDDS